MKIILLLTCTLTLLSTTGCLVTEGGWHGRGRHSEVIVGPPAVVVPVPIVVVHPR